MSHNASSMAYIIIGNQNLTSAPTQHSLQLLIGDNKGGQLVGCVPAVPMRPTIGPTFTSLQNKFHPNLCATRTYQGGVNHNVMSSMLSAHQKETVIEITKIPIEDCQKDSKVATLHAADTGVQHSLQEAAKRIKLEYRPKGTANVGTIAQMVNQQSFCHTPSDSSIVNAVNAHIQQPPTSRGYHIVLPPSGENKRYTVLSTEGLQPQATTGSGSTEKMDSSGQLDTSLTNIQWLGSMTGDTLVRNNNQVDHRVYVSEQQIEKVSRECGRSRRPPFSYMTMIQMAINSKPDKRMTLREIYGWVETKFPYYKYTAKQGWKNSIRHNLSLYELFVRERVSTPGLVGSYWTLKKESACKKATPRRSSGCVIAPKGGLPVVNAVSSVTQGLQEGSSNDWALVSLQGLQMLQSPCAEKIIPSSLRRPSDSRTSTGTKKQVKIAPRVSVCDGSQLITQAWLNASLGTSNLSDLLSLSGLTTGLNLTGTDSPGRDSGIDSQMSEKSSSDTSLAQSIPQKIEKKGRKRKRKATNTVRWDSCEYKPNPSALTNVSLSDSFLAGLENEFSSPIRQLLQTPPKFSDSRATSTPYRNKNASPEFCSPLRGFSPLRSLQDNNILTSPGRDTSLGLIPLTPENQRTPRAGSLSELGLHGFTPLAHGRNSSLGNHSFSRLFADIPLDGIDENSSIDIANLSWPDVPIL